MLVESLARIFGFAGASSGEDYCERVGVWVRGKEVVGETTAYGESEAAGNVGGLA